MFFSTLSVGKNDEERNRKSWKINTWLQAWCYQQDSVGFFLWVGLPGTRPAASRESPLETFTMCLDALPYNLR